MDPFVNVFAYGTLRTHPRAGSDHPRIIGWDPDGELVGEPGEWQLNSFGIWGPREGGVPAVRWTGDPNDKVVGDVYKVTLRGFNELLRYESFPHLYDYDTPTAHSVGGDEIEVVVFTNRTAESFGSRLPGGDYFHHTRHDTITGGC